MFFFRSCRCTHLQVHQKRIVNVSSFTITNDNSQGHKFYYDRQHPRVFSVPKGWAFVVTDIIVYASPVQGPIPDPNRFILAVVNFTNGGARHFTALFSGDNTMHYPLGGGYVVPSGHTPEFRNTTFSSSHAEANLLGYFVKGNGLDANESAFPEMQDSTEEVKASVSLFRK
jgi:hypothetical protein